MRILLVEDEEPIAAVIKRGLSESHYTVDTAKDGAEGLEMARDGNYGLIILDLMLPKMDGWAVCRALRSERNSTPILMLTARDAVEDRVAGLDLGADDYLPKPFDFGELIARVRSLLRRDKVHKSRVIQIGDLEIDTAAHRVVRGEQEITLTRREYALLEALALNEGRVLTREIIQDQVWMNEESYSNTVDVHIGSLRKKIDSGSDVKLIHTIHGLGYTLRNPAAEETP